MILNNKPINFHTYIEIAYRDGNNCKMYLFAATHEHEFKLTMIEEFIQNGTNGKTYKKVEIFHHIYKKTITNYETGEFDTPEIPKEVLKKAEEYYKGFIASQFFANS